MKNTTKMFATLNIKYLFFFVINIIWILIFYLIDSFKLKEGSFNFVRAFLFILLVTNVLCYFLFLSSYFYRRKEAKTTTKKRKKVIITSLKNKSTFKLAKDLEFILFIFLVFFSLAFFLTSRSDKTFLIVLTSSLLVFFLIFFYTAKKIDTIAEKSEPGNQSFLKFKKSSQLYISGYIFFKVNFLVLILLINIIFLFNSSNISNNSENNISTTLEKNYALFGVETFLFPFMLYYSDKLTESFLLIKFSSNLKRKLKQRNL